MTTSILFVCLGNICRSPLAEGIFGSVSNQIAPNQRFEIDSAGTGAWHQGNPPDRRSIAVAARYGIDISQQRARQIKPADFSRFDLIVAMDRDNLATLHARNPSEGPRIRLLLTEPDQDVPDPYYGGGDGFETVYRMIENGCHKLVRAIESGRL
ncbi:low molecular weight phosphotyrosine protein phosphatase [Roseibium denhamense]|uniref:protein-tyrosine-phosphatase n=1 Tax=Roseibium denhamense TaxID=76305 RepID=A0ABY1P948_9HYPH|nr:low molecular weight protein-tyrosine-phosphatase [Roseibium denhamense]MTI07387.1 low molecular weight phosphotyrosine protein phosphatase [Roseibium denhamense]SMP29250.1 protein-tyrosine phosphatase [Roseibium denhamense]